MTHPTVFLIEEAKNEWEQELEAHVGQIYLPDGKWKDPVLKAPLAFIEDDVWSDPKEQIVMPDYEVEMARFMDSAYAAGYCMKQVRNVRNRRLFPLIVTKKMTLLVLCLCLAT